MEFIKAVGALTAVFYATAIVGCLGSDLCSMPGTEEWWATIGRLAVYSPVISFVIVSGVFLIRKIASMIRRRRQPQADEQ
jgi:hypothetical protein